MVDYELLNKIELVYPKLSRKQQLLADAVLESWESIAFLSPKELGDRLSVSETTVIRFAKILGYRNYSELREHIRNMMLVQVTPEGKMTESIDKIKDDPDYLTRLLTREVDLLAEGIKKVSLKEFYRAIELIDNANRVFLMGFGVSASLCRFLEFRFSRMGIDTKIIVDNGGSFHDRIALMNQDDILIGIGFFRCAEEILKAFDYANERNISTVAVTHSAVSELALKATATIVANRGPIQEVNSLAVPMAILNALVICLAQKNEEKSSSAFRHLDEVKNFFNPQSVDGQK